MDEKTLQREKLKVQAQNKRAIQHGVDAILTVEQWIQTLNHFQWQCAYCMKAYEVLEHFIPLPLQGGTSVFNCLPACLRCNSRKGDAHPSTLDWISPSTLLYIRSYFVSIHTGEAQQRQEKQKVMKEDNPDAIYTKKQVAAYIRVSERSVNNLLSSGELKGVFIQGRWMFAMEAIQEYIKSCMPAKGAKGSVK